MEKRELLANAFEKLEILGDGINEIFNKVNEKQFNEEIDKMLEFMETKIEGIKRVDIKSISFDLIDETIEIVFIFTAYNITLKDNRCYTIRLI